ncbi:hypothetical protein HN587_02765 [Candidatus Woesearchaeota archaeon]|jgi:MtN3 and saliva related transmembrane protein|nr:hypothetical protein [Candidatus Woesearchaeota archaeon]
MLLTIFSVLVTILGVAMSIGHLIQAHKIYKRKSANDISIITYSTFTIGSYVWLIYGILLKELPIILSFVIAVVGTTAVMVLIFKYK